MYKSRVSPLLTFKNCCVRRRIGTIIFCKYWLLINQIDRNYSCFVITTHSKCKIIYLKLTVMENYNSFLEYYHTKAFFKAFSLRVLSNRNLLNFFLQISKSGRTKDQIIIRNIFWYFLLWKTIQDPVQMVHSVLVHRLTILRGSLSSVQPGTLLVNCGRLHIGQLEWSIVH